jgi:hypothetical protein
MCFDVERARRSVQALLQYLWPSGFEPGAVTFRQSSRDRKGSKAVKEIEIVAPDQDQKERPLNEDELSTVSGGFGFVEFGATTVIKSIGEALSTVARKQ